MEDNIEQLQEKLRELEQEWESCGCETLQHEILRISDLIYDTKKQKT